MLLYDAAVVDTGWLQLDFPVERFVRRLAVGMDEVGVLELWKERSDVRDFTYKAAVVEAPVGKAAVVHTLVCPLTSKTLLPLPGFDTTIASSSFSSVMSGNFFL